MTRPDTFYRFAFLNSYMHVYVLLKTFLANQRFKSHILIHKLDNTKQFLSFLLPQFVNCFLCIIEVYNQRQTWLALDLGIVQSFTDEENNISDNF